MWIPIKVLIIIVLGVKMIQWWFFKNHFLLEIDTEVFMSEMIYLEFSSKQKKNGKRSMKEQLSVDRYQSWEKNKWGFSLRFVLLLDVFNIFITKLNLKRSDDVWV